MASKQEEKKIKNLAILAEHFLQTGKDELEQGKHWKTDVTYGEWGIGKVFQGNNQ